MTTTPTLTTQWLANAQELADFVAEHRRMPHQTKDGMVGRRLKSWRNPGKLGIARQEHLDTLVPGWRPTRSVTGAKRGSMNRVSWEQRAQEALDLFAQEGRFPQRSERPLGTWLSNQRNNSQLTSEREMWLNDNLPGWRGIDNSKRSRDLLEWLCSVTELPAVGTEEYSRLQAINFSTASKGAQNQLRRLGLAPMNCEQRATRNLLNLKAFVKVRGRLPREYRGLVPAEEVLLAQFVRRCRSSVGVNPQRDKFMDKHAPGWRVVGVTQVPWNRALEELEAFVSKNGRLPEPHEGASGRRLQRWRRPSQLTPERRALLDRKFPSWHRYVQKEQAA